MSVDLHQTGQDRFAALRASLSEEFETQTVRLKQLTAVGASAGDAGEAHNQAALLAATRQNLEQITGALRRLAEGTYGDCERCTRPIPAERLEVVPHARFCVPCQQQHPR